MPMDVTEAVLSRRSIRRFLPREVPCEVLARVFDKARWAPSGCNFQPWEATLLTGAPLRALQEKLLAAPVQDPPEYSWLEPDALPHCRARREAAGALMSDARGIARDDVAARDAAARENLTSFGAPTLLLVHLSRVMAAPQWSDVGMWLQTIMLLLREEGLDSCPQESLARYGRLIKDHIGVADESHIFFCGLAIGYRDAHAVINTFPRQRAELETLVRFSGFEQVPA